MRTAALVVMVTSLLAFYPGAAGAQRAGRGVPQAFSVVQAPESAVEWCHASSARAAQDCALAKCQKRAGRGACFAVTTCEPSGWAGIMGVQLKEAHFSESICGAPTREAALAALKAFCRGHMPGVQHCTVQFLWGPDGKPEKVELNWAAVDIAG